MTKITTDLIDAGQKLHFMFIYIYKMNISKQGDLEIRYYIPLIRNGAISSFFLSSTKGNPQVIIDVSYIGKQTTEKIF